MIVCLCFGVNERDVERAIEQGAKSVRAVGEACNAGRGCFTCADHIQSMLDRHHAERGRGSLTLLGPNALVPAAAGREP